MKKGLTIGGIILSVVLLSVFVLAVTGKKEVNTDGNNRELQQKETNTNGQQKEEINYQGMGNMQGNAENGGYQTFLGNDRILVRTLVSETIGNRMFYFDTDTQTLRMGCDREDCLHYGPECAASHDFSFLQSYGNVYFGVPQDSNLEIWKVEQGEMDCFYRSDDGIAGIWCYNGYLYYMTELGVYRIPVKGKGDAKQVLDRPVLYEYLTFYEDSMYFCEDTMLLYKADLDGKNKKRLLEEKVVSPQVYDGRIYYRSAEYDSKRQYGMKNTLCSVTLDGKGKEKLVEQAYQFCMADGGIYYLELPEDGESTLHYLDLKTKKQHKITECSAYGICIFEQTDWILFEKPEGQLPEGHIGGRPEHLFCVKKDGTQCKRLEYPEIIGGQE